MEVVERIKHELKKYGVNVPRQIRTLRGLKSYLETQITQERLAVDRLKFKIEEKEQKIEIIKSFLKELEIYRKKEIVKRGDKA